MDLTLNQVRVGYGRHDVISGLSSSLTGGRITGLIGPNGSGKSTLIRAIAGVHPHRGLIALDELKGRSLRRRTGYMPQEIPGNIGLSALESVVVASRRGSTWHIPRSEVESAFAVLSSLGISALADKMLGECSGGQRQLISLAQTLARQPQLVLLDEPTSALDLRHQTRVLHRLRDYVLADRDRPTSTGEHEDDRDRRLAIVALHDLNLAARYCDDLLLLQDGELVAHGPVRKVLVPRILDPVYGVSSRIIPDGDQVLVVAEETPSSMSSQASG